MVGIDEYKIFVIRTAAPSFLAFFVFSILIGEWFVDWLKFLRFGKRLDVVV